MTFEVVGFIPHAELNYNTGLGQPVFEYIYGKQTVENGIQTKYIQQYDKVTLETNMEVTSVEVSNPNHLEAKITSGNTIEVRAKGSYAELDVWNDYIIVNNNPNYRFNFKIYRYANYKQQMSVFYVSYLYWLKKEYRYIDYDSELKEKTGSFGYTGGDASKSITKKIHLYSSVNMYYDDCIAMDDYPVKRAFNLIEEYHRRGYKNLLINVPLEISNKSLIFIAY